MRHTAIVVLVLAAAVSACTQTPVEQGSAANPSGSTALTSVSSGTAGAPDQGGSPAGGANGAAPGSTGESGTTALNGVHAATPMGAVNAGAAPAPTFTEVTIPAGTALPVVLESTVGSDSSAVEQAVVARLADVVDVGGVAALPAGSTLHGVVTQVERAGKVKGRAQVAFRFTEVSRAGESERYPMETKAISRTAAATKKQDAVKVGGGALGGAIVGGIIGGKKGAAIGTAAGAGAGGAVVMSTRGEEVRLPQGTKVSVTLASPLTVRIPSR